MWLFSQSEHSLHLGITLWSCLIERSPDLTFIWGFVRSFSNDILIRLGNSAAVELSLFVQMFADFEGHT